MSRNNVLNNSLVAREGFGIYVKTSIRSLLSFRMPFPVPPAESKAANLEELWIQYFRRGDLASDWLQSIAQVGKSEAISGCLSNMESALRSHSIHASALSVK